jgi:ribose/xylose/arabinose/galactoside ABC-type transport system permease subunit
MFEGIGKFIILMGFILILVGVAFLLFEKFQIPQNPLDFHFKGKNFEFYFPLGTSLLLSIILTVLLNLAIWIFLWLTRK